MLCAVGATAQELDNGKLRLTLGFTADGVPILQEGVWTKTGESVFRDDGASAAVNEWLPDGIVPAGGSIAGSQAWLVTEDDNLNIAEARVQLPNGLNVAWVVELPKSGSLFRLHVRITNVGRKSRKVEWFPGWVAAWAVPNGAGWMRWWQALWATPIEQDLSADSLIELGSRLHSSDISAGGVNPFWTIGGQGTQLHFGVEWCGGWSAKIKSLEGGFKFDVRLPPEETQLKLRPGESIDGPAVLVTPTTGTLESYHRHSWLLQRLALARSLYVGPAPSFPLTYNHWYVVGFHLTSDFLRKQIASMEPYRFDAFIVDAGWYKKVGKWQPNPKRFDPGEFEALMASIKAGGVKVGIWSCPQFIHGSAESLPREAEDPPVYSSFVDAYLLDLADSDFAGRLTGHVSMLRDRYSADWWKYDQEFFSEQSRAGAMRNVVAFQDALKAVRRANPDLTIENCEAGGRMLNSLTVLATQTSWLRDGGNNGLAHARQNISIGLGALDFLFPWTIYRWTNNLDQMDQNDDELTRFYCRSAMIGTWGISSDLSLIGSRQQAVVLKEIENYRRMNESKRHCLYDLRQPYDGAEVAGVTYYGRRQRRAAVLLYRWDREGPFETNITLHNLKPNSRYRVTDADTGNAAEATGADLLRDGLGVSFTSDRLSALVFIDRTS